MNKCRYCISNDDEMHDDLWTSVVEKQFEFKQEIRAVHDFTNSSVLFKNNRVMLADVFIHGDIGEMSLSVVTNDRWDIDDLVVVKHKKIKYCPMCGRKLNKGGKAEK